MLRELPTASASTELARILSSATKREGRRYGPWMEFREKAALDPWRTQLFYERSPDGQSFRLGSAGPDSKFGTDDDFFVESPKPKKQKATGED